MDSLVARFIRAALIYFMVGMALGAVLIFWPLWPSVMRTIHVHVNLLGWLAMVVYAAGYGLVPRLAGRPLHSPRLAEFQFWLSNLTLIALSLSWIIVSIQEKDTLIYAFFYALLALSTLLMLISAFLFAYNLIMTMKQK